MWERRGILKTKAPAALTGNFYPRGKLHWLSPATNDRVEVRPNSRKVYTRRSRASSPAALVLGTSTLSCSRKALTMNIAGKRFLPILLSLLILTLLTPVLAFAQVPPQATSGERESAAEQQSDSVANFAV